MEPASSFRPQDGDSCEIITADPAGNITVFVLGEVRDRDRVVRRIMADGSLGAEQVGFVVPPVSPAGHWRLEMMGGEFCGNAARRFGLLAARFLGLSGKAAVTVETSGMDRPLTVRVDMDAGPARPGPGDAAAGTGAGETDAAAGTAEPGVEDGAGMAGFSGPAELEIPGPLRETSILLEGRSLPALVFDGITHVIAPDMAPERERFDTIKKAVEAGSAQRPAGGPGARSPAGLDAGSVSGLPALGVMFWDSRKQFMTPAVYVYRSGALVFESSCGSGSAALAVWLDREAAASPDCGGGRRFSIRQPGGIIETRVTRRDGGLSVSIGGRVTLSGKRVLF
jgi:diaminopimelate epimerase